VIHPPHLALYAIVAATTCGAGLVFLVFVSLYSFARLLVHLIRWARERGEGRRDLQAEIHAAVLEIMPWPIYRNMTDHDLRAIDEYLSAVPYIAGPPAPSPLHNDCR
jgi:hypothetical protein